MKRRTRYRPVCESLEERLALSHAAVAAHHGPRLIAPADRHIPVVPSFRTRDINGDGVVDVGDLKTMSEAYLTVAGQDRYNPAADLNRDGKINQYDARYLVKGLPAPPARVPLQLALHLAPGQTVPHPGEIHNSGAVVRRTKNVTILGRTIPGALVFADSSQGLYQFNGALLPTDAQGNFVDHVEIDGKFSATISFLVIDQYGRQLVRNYPVYRA